MKDTQLKGGRSLCFYLCETSLDVREGSEVGGTVAAAEKPAVETDGHVTQWLQREMNGEEKGGKNNCQPLGSRGQDCVEASGWAESWMTLLEAMASFPIIGITLEL